MRWSMLPVSICVHVSIGLAVLIVPLGADEWPLPEPLHSPSVAMKTAPVPTSMVRPAVSRPAVGVTAPLTIEPEREILPTAAGPVAPTIPDLDTIPFGGTGMPGGFGTVAVVTPPPLPAPAPSAPPSLIRAGHGVREPKKVVDVRPVYPAIAQSVKVQGSVILEAVINERGSVERIKVLHSIPLLDGAAIAAVQAWRYTPTTLNGVPVSVLMTITINFTLND